MHNEDRRAWRACRERMVLKMDLRPPSKSNKCIARITGYGTQVRSARQDPLDIGSVKFATELFRPVAVDLGCGEGEQAIAMALAGARVAAIDHLNFAGLVRRRSMARGLPIGAIQFWREDAANADHLLRRGLPAPDVLYCQRMLHYLPYSRAHGVLMAFRGRMKPGSRLYLGLSGIRSELGIAYSHRRRPVHLRFCLLAPSAAQAHKITRPICLYELADAVRLAHTAGFRVLSAETSTFGNLKIVAEVI